MIVPILILTLGITTGALVIVWLEKEISTSIQQCVVPSAPVLSIHMVEWHLLHRYENNYASFLADKVPSYAFALVGQSPFSMRNPLHTFVTFWEAYAP